MEQDDIEAMNEYLAGLRLQPSAGQALIVEMPYRICSEFRAPWQLGAR